MATTHRHRDAATKSATAAVVVAALAAAALGAVLAGGIAEAQTPSAPSISDVAEGDRALTVAWTAPSDDGITAYDLRYIETSADETVDAGWTAVETVWQSGPLHYVLAGLDNGTGYDVQVRAVTTAAGAWSETMTGTPADHGATRGSATVLDLGVPAGGFIESSSDVDFFELALTEPMGLLAYSTGGVSASGTLHDSSGKLIDAGDLDNPLASEGGFVTVRRLARGTYYIKVAGLSGSNGAYVVHTFGIVDSPTFAEAVPVAVNSVTHGILDDPESVGDYFKLELSEQTDLLIRTSGSVHDTAGSLYNAQQELIAGNDDGYLSNDQQFMIRTLLDAGVYYIKVSGYSRFSRGSYSLHVSEIVERGSTISDAGPLAVGGAAAGRIEPADDVDYFRLKVRDHGLFVIRAVSEFAGINATLLDSDANPLGAHRSEDILGVDRLIGATFVRTLEEGTYYLRVDTEGWDSSTGETATGAYAVAAFEHLRYRDLRASCGSGDASVSDPLYGCQWNLDNHGQFGATPGEDINVGDVWQTTTGTGVTVAVVDDGVDNTHEDLSPGFDTSKSHDYTRTLGFYTPTETHGTAVAGIIAASDNGVGIRGVAPGASIRSFNLLLDYTLANEADAMAREADTTAVSSNSWGPVDHAGVDRAPRLWELAVEAGLAEGYSGLGTFYAWAAGNGHAVGDNSNLDEFANFYGVTAVCAVNHSGRRSRYSEKGANLWVCAPSSNGPGSLGITTTDTAVLGGYTDSFSGTSAAAPQVSGVAALARSVNPALSWRDVKLILAGSARKNDPGDSGWEAGALQYGSDAESYEFNHSYGFGVVDAEAAVELAETWTNVPSLAEERIEPADSMLAVPDNGTAVSTSVTVGSQVQFVEFVAVEVALQALNFRSLKMDLVSPSGAVSQLMVPHTSWSGLFADHGPYRLGSARHLGEDPEGEWTLRITDKASDGHTSKLVSWALTVYGHRSSPGPPEITSVDGVNDPLTVAWEAPATAGSSAVTGYDLRFIRSDATDKDDDSAWTQATGVWTSGPLSHTISASELESEVNYDMQVRAVNSSGSGAWSRVVAARLGGALSAPQFPSSETGRRSVVENTAAGVDVGAAVAAEDAGDDALTYTKRGADAAAFEIVASTGQLRTKAAVDYESQTSFGFTVIATDDSGLSDEIEVTVSVRDVNEPPVMNGTSKRSVTEGPPRGLGMHFRASDPERLDPTWSMSGPDASLFTLEPPQPSWYQVFVSRDLIALQFIEPPDFEAAADADGDNVYEVTVEASDGVQSASLAIEVTVLDDNEPPELSGDVAVLFEENGVGAVASYEARDPEGGAVRWSVSGSDRRRFSIESGELRFRSSPDFETAADVGGDNVYNVRVSARDDSDDALSSSLDVVVTVGDVDEGGSLVLSSVQPAVGAELTTVLSDPDGDVSGEVWVWARSDDRSTWTTVSSAGSYTPVDADVGMYLRLAASYVDAHGSRKSLVQETAAVRERPANNPPQFAAGETGERSVVENTAAAVSVGAAVAAVDPERDRLVYSLGGDDAAVFDIVEATGQLRTKEELNYEADDSYSLVVSVRDNIDVDGNADTEVDDTVAVTVTVIDVNEPVTLEGDTAVDYDENDDAVVGSYRAVDPEMRTVTLSLSGADAGRFSISSGGVLGFRSPPDFEARADANSDNDYLVTVRASDGATTATLDVVVSLVDVSEPPQFPPGETGARSVEENTATGVSIGAAVAAVDPERDRLVYSLGGDDAAVFDIVEATGQLRTKEELNYEADDSYSLVVSVRDNKDVDGNADTATDDTVAVTVTVVDLNEPPVVTGDATVDYVENATGPVAAYDADDPERVDVVWSLGSADGGDFVVSGGGVVSFDPSAGSPDFEDPDDTDDDNRYEIEVRAFDGLNTVAHAVVVNVVNADEAGMVVLSSQQPQALTPLSASLRDPDGGVAGVSWQWQSSTDPSDPNSWSDIAGASGSGFTPASGDVGSYLRVGAFYEDGHAAGKTAGVAAGAAVRAAPPVNHPPQFGGSGTWQRSVLENTAAGAGIGDPVAAQDPNTNDRLNYTLGGADDGSFDLDPATGQLRTKEALDRERRSSYTVTVTATDPSGEFDTVTVVVTVTDIDEAPQLSGPTAANHQENSTEPVAFYLAPDPEQATVTWSKSGDDAGAFTIAGGSLEFRDPPDFDRPADTRRNNNYHVTVRASDGDKVSEISVIVTVTGVDEAPTVTGNKNPEHPENTTPVGAYTAADPERKPVNWLPLEGDDADLFAFSDDAKLSFKLTPDHETPNDTGRDSVYDLTLVVSDDTKTTRWPLTVTVTDQNDFGTIILPTQQPRIGEPLTAVLSDPDGAVSDVLWQWENTADQTDWNDIDGATTAHYTPTAADQDHHLRVTTTYTDAFGPDQTTQAQTHQPVTGAADPDRPRRPGGGGGGVGPGGGGGGIGPGGVGPGGGGGGVGPGGNEEDEEDEEEDEPDDDDDEEDEEEDEDEEDDEEDDEEEPDDDEEEEPGDDEEEPDDDHEDDGEEDDEGETAPRDTAAFTDVSAANVHAANIDALFAAGITVGCGREPLRFCPSEPVTRAQMATFLARALSLDPPKDTAAFTDVSAANVHAANIDALFAAGITVGCGREPLRFCPSEPVTRAQMATFLARALSLDPPKDTAAFTDVSASNVHAANIDALFAAGITVGCGREPLRFCPSEPVTRAQMATFLARALNLGQPALPELAEPQGSEPGAALAAKLDAALDPPVGASGGARQSDPEGSTRNAGFDDRASAQGAVYTWSDGDRTLRARLQTDLVVLDEDALTERDDIVTHKSGGQILAFIEDDSRGSDGPLAGHPVFRSASGTLMTLPGGVVLVLDPEWITGEVDAFLAGHGIKLDRVSELGYLTNGFFVETDPGFASLKLANALAGQDGVELSSPNWWREHTTK